MQATEMFQGLLTEMKTRTLEPFPPKADVFLPAKGSFQAVFDRAVRQPERQESNNNLADLRRDPVERPAANESAAQSAKRARGDAAEDRRVSAQSARETQSRQRVESSANQQASTESKARTAEAQQTVRDQVDANGKMEALVERLEQEITKGDGIADEQMVELLMQLLAMLVEAMQNPNGENADASGLKVALELDPDSKLYEIFQLLLQGREGLTEEDLEGVNILLKLTDDKGLLIPLSELVRSDVSENDVGQSMKLTLQMTDAGDAAKTVELDLAINADDMKSAQMVSLSNPALKESELVMMIPLERLVADNAAGADGKDLDALLARVMQGSKDEQVLQFQDKGMAATSAEQEAVSSESRQTQVLVPLKPASGPESNAPKVLTADPMLISSDEYLKALDMDALAKELVTAGDKRKEIFDRLSRLMLEKGSASQSLEKILIKKADASLFMGDLLKDFSESANQDARKWSSSLLKEDAATVKANVSEPNTARISFLGRPVAQNAFNEVLTTRTEAARAAPGQNLQESVMNQVIQKVSYTFLSGTDGEVRVILRPANLGDLTLKVKVEQDVVTAKIMAQSHEVKAIIENNLGQLKQALEELGVKVGQFDVEVNTGTNGQPENGPQDRTDDAYYTDGASDDAASPGNSLEIDFDGFSTYSVRGDIATNLSRVSYFA